MNKNEKTGLIIGSIAAAVASVAGCVATVKAVKEIKESGINMDLRLVFPCNGYGSKSILMPLSLISLTARANSISLPLAIPE